ncbi:MAG: molybdate ABC transporter substrate-binding protein [Bryobacteraceae bacterium]|jgi:molybdate transport system substrate-binding protein
MTVSFTRTTLALAALLSVACSGPPAPLRIAAAADLRYALGDVVKDFRQRHAEIRIEPTYGSSGMFYAQLASRAPFDLYLSADVQYPRKLSEQGLTLPGSDFTYADGRIVLWTGNASGVDVARLGMDALRQPAVRHIAIANPAHAPYGRAAEAALRSLGIYDAVQGKLVMGENISQAFQMAQSGAAEVGIVALSLAIAPGAVGQGHYWEVPRDAYPRIQQGGAIMKWTKNPEAARAFRAFLLAPEGRAILKRYGFSAD